MGGTSNIAVSGMMSQAKKLDVISNNIANSNTLSFKSQWVQFMEEFVSQGRQTNNGNIIQGGAGTKVASVNSNWAPGPVQVTNEPSHLMVAGDGFLPVAFNGEVYYTRAGDFSLVKDPRAGMDGSFVLMRPNGATLLGFAGLPVGSSPAVNDLVSFRSNDPVNFPIAPTSYEVSAKGTITAKPDDTSLTPHIVVSNPQLALQRFNNNGSLVKSEGGLYKPTQATSLSSTFPVEPGTNGTGTLTQGALEESNTDLIVEFTQMIQAQRAFQANSKVITTADEMFQTVMGMKR